MELRDCNFNGKGEIVCEEVQLSLKNDSKSINADLRTSDLDLTTPPKKYSELPDSNKKLV